MATRLAKEREQSLRRMTEMMRKLSLGQSSSKGHAHEAGGRQGPFWDLWKWGAPKG